MTVFVFMLNVLESSKLHNHNNLHPNSKHAGLDCNAPVGRVSILHDSNNTSAANQLLLPFDSNWSGIFVMVYEIFPHNWVVKSRIYPEQPRWFSMLKWSFLWLFCPLRYTSLKLNMVHWKRRCLPLTLIFRDFLLNFRGVSVSSPIANQSRCQKRGFINKSQKKNEHTQKAEHTQKKTSCLQAELFWHAALFNGTPSLHKFQVGICSDLGGPGSTNKQWEAYVDREPLIK